MQNGAGIATTTCCAHIIQMIFYLCLSVAMGSLLCVSVEVSISDNI